MHGLFEHSDPANCSSPIMHILIKRLTQWQAAICSKSTSQANATLAAISAEASQVQQRCHISSLAKFTQLKSQIHSRE
jgi:hypothetical protein